MGTHPIFESDFDCLTDRMLKNVKASSPDPIGIVEITWNEKGEFTKSENKDLDYLLKELLNENSAKNAWENIRTLPDLNIIINSPGIMKFLQRCNHGSYWPEDIISEILEAGATGPHVTAILDKAHKLSSSKVITATNSQSLPERALVWALESSIRKLSQDQSESNETNLDVILKRPFSHNHLVGALRGLDSNLTIALLDFLINKAKKTDKWSEDADVNIIDLAAWIGAVIDAHPTTITTDGNEEYLTEALAVVNTKLEILNEHDELDKLLLKSRWKQG